MNAKVALLVLALLILLFCVGVGVGIGQGDGRSPGLPLSGEQGEPRWLTRMGNWLPKEQLTVEAILRSEPLHCLQANPDRIVITRGQSCQLQIAPAKSNRTLTWQLTSGQEARLALVQPVNAEGDPLTAKQTVTNDEQVSLDFYRQQQENDEIVLDIICAGSDIADCILIWPATAEP